MTATYPEPRFDPPWTIVSDNRTQPFCLSMKLRRRPSHVFARLFRRRRERRAASPLYLAIVAQARQPGFYSGLSVPDSVDGRFELLALHTILVMHRLKGQGVLAEERARATYELMIADFEVSLSQMGVGDSGIAPRVKRMLRGMAGRINAYDKAFGDADDGALEIVIDNNLYGTNQAVSADQLKAMVRYVRSSVRALATQPTDLIAQGKPDFGPVDASLPENPAGNA